MTYSQIGCCSTCDSIDTTQTSEIDSFCNQFDQEWKLLEDFTQNMTTIYRRRVGESREDTRWTLVRPRTSWDFIDFGNLDPAVPLFDKETDREKQLVEDLLNCFLGFHGRYINAESLEDPNGVRVFKISECITGVWRSMATRLLPLAAYYSRIVRYVQNGLDLNAGRVNHSLASFLQEKIMRFSEMIVKLEEKHAKRPLDLNRIYFYLQGTMASMKVLNDIVVAVQGQRGGQTLSALHNFTNLCIIDSHAKKLSVDAIVTAAEPYFETLSMWIYKGKLFDPYDEFLVAYKDNGMLNMNWDSMFHLKMEEVPVFLKDCQNHIYKAGKYLDAVRRSLNEEEEMPQCHEEDLKYDATDERYVGIIRRAHHFACITLKTLMLNKYNLFDRIKTAKSFLCLEGGDLFHNIYDNCGEELDRPAYEVCVSYLPVLVSSSIENSSLGSLKHSNQMALFLEKETLRWQVYNLHPFSDKQQECHEEQSGLEAVTFKVMTKWPISLVIHPMSIKCYQMLFRHLFYLKRIHFKLVRARQVRPFKSLRQYYLKHIMTVFLQCCISYMTTGTIEAHWLEFQDAFNEALNIEEISHAHESMLYKCLQGCMLASPKLFHKLRKVLDICLKFADDSSLKHEQPFIIAVAGLIKAALFEGPSAGLENFTKEIAPIFQYEPTIASIA